ncbi:MAG: pyridoxal-phosphate dependent enzyme [Acidobacteria bacterium]|nr:pyridoxal-phosphate dependent enzyme [Acidobacteriota bacterium]MCH8991872.1 pyridoxal-phosphate dependent enzyme [Acidobacteriota bacterium]
MEVHDHIVDTIGNTPMVRLGRIHPHGNLVAKLEYLNPGGSSKDRIGVAMIERAERNGWLKPGGTIIEPTSGNTGVALAMAASLKGYKLIAVIGDKQSVDKQDLLRAYGAEVVVCPSGVPPDDPRSYYSVANRLLAEVPGAYIPDQYSNPANPQAQYDTTGPEIWRQTDGGVGVFACGIGTGGTISGVGRYLKEQNPEVTVVGIDPEGSIFTAASDDEVTGYLIEGVGEDFWPETFDPKIVDSYETVSDDEAFAMTRRLVDEERILVGGSGGMAVVGAFRVAEERPDDLVVVLLPDSGRNYLTKIFNDDWMREKGFIE